MEMLTAEAFAPFGDVLQIDGIEPQIINQGHTQKFADLANISLGDKGRAQLSIYRSSAIEFPFPVTAMERHPLASQAFYPLHDRPFPVIVANANCVPGEETIQAFLTNGKQGINLHPGVWHHYQLSLEQNSDYLVIDRGGSATNCDVQKLQQEILVTR
jgi:ureidoglycolate lyase